MEDQETTGELVGDRQGPAAAELANGEFNFNRVLIKTSHLFQLSVLFSRPFWHWSTSFPAE